ncbi:hypothetical protein P7C70_g1558, partial [Phenoliferia sp. Uapishka_3]
MANTDPFDIDSVLGNVDLSLGAQAGTGSAAPESGAQNHHQDFTFVPPDVESASSEFKLKSPAKRTLAMFASDQPASDLSSLENDFELPVTKKDIRQTAAIFSFLQDISNGQGSSQGAGTIKLKDIDMSKETERNIKGIVARIYLNPRFSSYNSNEVLYRDTMAFLRRRPDLLGVNRPMLEPTNAAGVAALKSFIGDQGSKLRDRLKSSAWFSADEASKKRSTLVEMGVKLLSPYNIPLSLAMAYRLAFLRAMAHSEKNPNRLKIAENNDDEEKNWVWNKKWWANIDSALTNLAQKKASDLNEAAKVNLYFSSIYKKDLEVFGGEPVPEDADADRAEAEITSVWE